MTRPLHAYIDSAALRHNLRRVRELAPGCPVVAVVKSDGYGHGLLRAAEALRQAEGLGVARVEDAATLRAAAYGGEILLLEGMYEPGELPEIARLQAVAVVHHAEQLRMLERSPPPAPVRVWLKFDTGMHRIGFRPSEAQRLIERVRDLPGARLEGAMSHLANADDPDDPCTAEQIARFAAIALPAGCARSLANSAGVVAWPQSRAGWVRPGLMLYGAGPLTGVPATEHGLRPAMRLCSRLISVRELAAGEAVGYGGTYCCPQDMRIGVVACGYGDGYPRHAPSGTPVWVAGRRVPLAGRVSMGMLTVDLRGVPDAEVGAPVELWGRNVHVDEVAAAAATVSYELMCGVAASVPRVEGSGGD